MARLRIYAHPSGDSALHRSGFSFTAAIAFPAWAIAHRLYRTAAVSCVVLLGVSQLVPRLAVTIHHPIARGLASLLYIAAYWILVGSLAPRWHRRVLEREGYFVTACETADLPRHRQ